MKTYVDVLLSLSDLELGAVRPCGVAGFISWHDADEAQRESQASQVRRCARLVYRLPDPINPDAQRAMLRSEASQFLRGVTTYRGHVVRVGERLRAELLRRASADAATLVQMQEEELADLDREQATPRAIITAGIAVGQAHLRELDAARARLAPAELTLEPCTTPDNRECVDASPAIRCTPEVGCVFKTPAGYVLTIDPLDGGDCPTVNLSDVQEWLAVHDPRPGDPLRGDDAERVLEQVANHCSPEEAARRIAAAKLALAKMQRPACDRKLAPLDEGKVGHMPLALVVWPGSAYDRTVVRVSDCSNDVDGYASCVTEDADGERDNAAIPRRCLRDVPQLVGTARDQLTLGSTWHGPYRVSTWQDVPDGGVARSTTGMWVVRRGDKFDVVKGWLQKPGEFVAPRFDDPDCEGRLYDACEMDDLAGRDTHASKACRLPAYVAAVLSIKSQTPEQFTTAEHLLERVVLS